MAKSGNVVAAHRSDDAADDRSKTKKMPPEDPQKGPIKLYQRQRGIYCTGRIVKLLAAAFDTRLPVNAPAPAVAKVETTASVSSRTNSLGGLVYSKNVRDSTAAVGTAPKRNPNNEYALSAETGRFIICLSSSASSICAFFFCK